MNKLLSLLVFCLFSQFCFGQNITDLKEHFNKLSNGKSAVMSKKAMQTYYEKPDAITLLESYVQSDNEKVQREAIRLCANIGSNNKLPFTRQIAVNHLMSAATNASATNNMRQIAKGLQRFKSEDFKPATIKQVEKMVRKDQPHLDKWIELAGFLQLKELLEEVKDTYEGNKDLRQKISIALTRCGDERKTKNLLKNLQKMKVNDEFVYGVVPLLVYTRQKETTDFLFDIILSDEKNCTPAGPDIKGNIECGYRVMEAIAPYVKGIPLELSASGDLKTNDYKKTLKETRAWIVTNRSNYELVTDVF